MSKRVDTAVVVLQVLRSRLRGENLATLECALAILDPRHKTTERVVARPAAPETPKRSAHPTRLYFLRIGDHIKIGISSNPWARVHDLRQGSPMVPELLGTVLGTLQDEKAWHARFAHLRAKGEWFRATEELYEAIRSALRSPTTDSTTDSATVMTTPPALSPTPPIPPQQNVEIADLQSSSLQKPLSATLQRSDAERAQYEAAKRIQNSGVERIFSELRKATTGAGYRLQLSDYDATVKACEWANEEHASDPEAAVRRSVEGFLRHAKGLTGPDNGYPYTSWSKDPARWYAATGDTSRAAPREDFDESRNPEWAR